MNRILVALAIKECNGKRAFQQKGENSHNLKVYSTNSVNALLVNYSVSCKDRTMITPVSRKWWRKKQGYVR